MEVENTHEIDALRESIISNLVRLDCSFDFVKSLQTSKHGWKKGYNLLAGGGVADLKFDFLPPLTKVKGWVRSEMTASLHYEASCTVSETDRSLQAFTCVCEGLVLCLVSLVYLTLII